MSAWSKQMGAQEKGVRMLADPRCEFTQATGCVQDDTGLLGGLRSRRYSMVCLRGCPQRCAPGLTPHARAHQIIQDNVVKHVNLEKPGPKARERTCAA